MDPLRHPDEWERLLDAIPAAVVVIAPGGEIVYANAELARLTGYRTEELRGQDVETLVPEAARAAHRQLRSRYEQRPRGRPMGAGIDITCRRADGSTFPAAVSLAPLRVAGSVYVVATVRDETDRRRSDEELFHRALHDPLTGLANRVLLLDRLEHVLARMPRQPAPVAVLYLDLDGFKGVNDRWGHGIGDEVLRVVAERLGAAVRPGDTVARFGGDEFVILCEGAEGSDEVVEIAGRLLDALDVPIDHGAGTARVTASVGIAMTGHRQRGGQDFIDAADRAMYRAKRSRRSKIAMADPLRRGVDSPAEPDHPARSSTSVPTPMRSATTTKRVPPAGRTPSSSPPVPVKRPT